MRFLKASAFTTMLLLNAVLLLTVVSLRAYPKSTAGGGGGIPTSRNGDLNCDGEIDIADPISLLTWLFVDKNAVPCAIAQDTEVCCTQVIDKLQVLKAAIDENMQKWPPKQENIVVFSGVAPEGPQGSIIYTVPDDKRFVLTTFAPADANVKFEISEQSGPGLTTRWPFTSNPFSSSVGISFSPGSKINLRIDNLSASSFPDVTAIKVAYSVNGYISSGQ